MSKINEKNQKNYVASNEEIRLERMKSLYQQMLYTTDNDEDYRAKIIHEILMCQKPDGSFRVIDTDACENDMRVFYIYYPTYYAVAAMMYAMNFDGDKAVPQDAFAKGLAVSMRNHFVGHGYDALDQQLEVLNIFKDACLYLWIRKYQSEYAEFAEMITSIIGGYRERLISGDVIDSWMVDYTEKFKKEVEDYDAAMVSHVWYASYGSNINYARFMEYINGCEDKSAPLDSKPITLPYSIYFADHISKWEGKGVAYLDDTCKGFALGRMYLITMEQFEQIKRFEGNNYSKKVNLGSLDGIPIYSFTSTNKRTNLAAPGTKYFNIILEGLKEIYTEKTELVLSVYLYMSGVLNADDIKVLQYIKNSEHGVSLRDISDNTVAITRVKKSIKNLVEHGFVKHDSRNAGLGYVVSDAEAVVYTCREKREIIDLILIINSRSWVME